MRLVLFATLVCMAAAVQKMNVGNMNHPDRVPGEFLIVLHKPAVSSMNVQYASSVAEKIAALSSKITIVNKFTNLMSPIIHIRTSDEAIMSQLSAFDEVSSIDVDMVQNMIQQCSSQNTGSRLWGLSRSSSRSQPDYSSATYSYGNNDGNGVRVYVHDTSIRLSHNDFGGRAVFGANFVGGSNNDNNGHGTHCAGTVGGAEFGVSKSTTLVAVKVLGDSGSGSFSGIIAGLDWMVGDVQSLGVRGVGSMSLGGGRNTALNSAVDSADAANIPVVTSAGNSNNNACNQSPAGADGAITVASTDINDNLSSFSSWGTCVDIMAPGSSILSASHLSDTGSRTLSGTSMACPHVAGLIATYLSENPNASSSQVKSYLASSGTKDAINLRGTSGTPNNLMYSVC